MPRRTEKKVTSISDYEKLQDESKESLDAGLWQEMAYTNDENAEENPLEDHYDFEDVASDEQKEAAKKKRELRAKIEESIKQQEAYATQMYDIINNEKNTMTYASAVYGDDADYAAISGSATGAIKDAEGKAATVGMVSVATVAGVRYMDKDVANALSRYSKMHPVSIIDRLEYENMDVADDIEFTREEEEKLEQLRYMIHKQDKDLYDFQNQTPEGMSDEEYAVWNRNRRFEKYGQLEEAKQITNEYDYYVLSDGTVRPLPEMTEEMKDYMREMEYTGTHTKQREEDKEYA